MACTVMIILHYTFNAHYHTRELERITIQGLKVCIMKSHKIKHFMYVSKCKLLLRMQKKTICIYLDSLLLQSATEQFPDLQEADDVEANLRGTLVLELKQWDKKITSVH